VCFARGLILNIIVMLSQSNMTLSRTVCYASIVLLTTEYLIAHPSFVGSVRRDTTPAFTIVNQPMLQREQKPEVRTPTSTAGLITPASHCNTSENNTTCLFETAVRIILFNEGAQFSFISVAMSDKLQPYQLLMYVAVAYSYNPEHTKGRSDETSHKHVIFKPWLQSSVYK